MSSASSLIAALRQALASTANESELAEFIDASLSSLRVKYRQSRDDFSAEALLFLKSLSALQEALRDFIEALEEKDWLRTRDDARELAARFGELRERLSPHVVARRADKELREMVEKAAALPPAAAATEEARRRHHRSQLEASSAPCQKCGSKMVLRESQYGYFWSCGTFPLCFARRGLSAAEAKKLFA